jgi:hypothetical protein
MAASNNFLSIYTTSRKPAKEEITHETSMQGFINSSNSITDGINFNT